jgi:GNAT superfamily N-acetyltransferase
MKIRRLGDDERPTISMPLQEYGFQPSPAGGSDLARLCDAQQYYKGNITLIVEDHGTALAEVSAIPMRQNVRGLVYAMAGVAEVVTQPIARRRGYARTLLIELLGEMRETGHVVSVLYPFRPSFYERFGYVGMPQHRKVTFSPADLASLLTTPLVGEITWDRIGDRYEVYRDFTQRLLAQRHGFSLLPDYRSVQLRDANERWLVTARVDREVVGAVTYRIVKQGGDLIADDLLTTNPLSRALLLQFFARHVDQVGRIVTTVAADETPELWVTDLATVTETKTSFPECPAPMGRVLSLSALSGMSAGPGRVAVEIIDDPFVAGHYILDGMAGILDVSRARLPVPTTTRTATLNSAGLSGLIYGVLQPEDIEIRGFGDVPRDAANEMRLLFPSLVPYVFASF